MPTIADLDNVIYLTSLRASAYTQAEKDTYTWMDPQHVVNLLNLIDDQRARLAAPQPPASPPQEGGMRKALVDSVFLSTVDPTVEMNGRPLPAATTLVYRVCDNDEKKFEEATRVVELFIAEALSRAALARDGGREG